jgi:hypothetical protein
MDFACRCDNLDPALAWTGVKNSGRGVSLSKFGAHLCLHEYAVLCPIASIIGYDQLTRAKSVHMKINTS